ncbi:MAG: DUF305 domain-containing protein [Acidimicrobiia bacterium]|nr:DUF305 domain-containing protein [Acidimicrobiia bacterium]
MRVRALVVAFGLAAVLGGACSSDDSTVTSPADAEIADAPHNDADIAFAQGMIPHHQQAVEMAQLATDRGEDERVLDLAARIEAAQAPEIEEMSGWLEAWGEDVPSGGAHGGEHGGGDTGSGMMTTEEMASLESAAGADFDRMFLEMMIGHHDGAIEMADTQAVEGEFPDAVELAQRIMTTQQSEIEEMQAVLADLA